MRMRTYIALCASISPAMAAAANPNAAAMLERIGGADSNRDGNVTKQEVISFRAANFARLDRDGNGVLTRGDIPAFAARMNPDIDFNRLIQQFDANGDKKVSRDEFVSGPTTYFDMADADRDGTLTKAERSAAIAAAKR
jgi:EF-hand domain pair/EF hand